MITIYDDINISWYRDNMIQEYRDIYTSSYHDNVLYR